MIINNERYFSQQEIFYVLDKAIKQTMEDKNRYIAKNGYKHTDTLKSFDTSISTLSFLYHYFDND